MQSELPIMKPSKLQLKMIRIFRPSFLKIFGAIFAITTTFLINVFCAPLHVDFVEGGGYAVSQCGPLTQFYNLIGIYSFFVFLNQIIIFYIALSLLYGLFLFLSERKTHVKS